MADNFAASSRVYTDIQGLKELRYGYKGNETAVKKEVAQQFESILMQMVLSSMRNANKAVSSDLFGSNQMEMYQDMFDKQVSLVMSNSDNSFAKVIENYIDRHTAGHNVASAAISNDYVRTTAAQDESVKQPVHQVITQPVTPVIAAAIAPHEKSMFHSPEDFVKKLWSSAKHAAELIGASPEILLAQAALETNWGRNILPHEKNTSSNNLFNIKADSAWNKKITTVDTLEQRNGVLSKEKANFRSYDSFKESFLDYVNFLKQNGRYNESLNKVANPEKFIHSLQKAGYATDQNYADKIMKIFSSHNFQNLVKKMKLNP